MNAIRSITVFLVLVVASSVTSCSRDRAPTFPDEPWRTAADFGTAWRVFGVDATYNETDLSVLVYGPDPPSGYPGDPAETLYDGEYRHWAIVVSVKHKNPLGGQLYDQIEYAWVDDVDSPPNRTPIKRATLMGDMSGNIIESVKVTSCYFYLSGDPDNSKIWVRVAYTSRSQGGTRNIGTFFSRWLQVEDDLEFPDTPQTVEVPTVFADSGPRYNDPAGGEDYCPDIAYDPETGDAHLVWTNEYSSPDPDYMLAYKRKPRLSAWEPDGYAYAVYEELAPHEMWHPRIDVGDPDGDGDKVGVVYTAYSDACGPCINDYHIGLSFWEPDETNLPDDATYEHRQYDPDEWCVAPRLDIAPGRNAGRYCSIVFTNISDEDEYEVIEVNNMRNDYLVLNRGGNDNGVYGAPVIHYGQNAVSVTYFVDTGDWDLYGTRFALNATSMTGNWAFIKGDIGGDFGPTSESDPGVEPGIVNMDDDNAYWAAWCNEVDSSADQVWANYGDSTL